MLRLRILGSGTLLPNHRSHSAAHLVAGPGFRLLLDCGSGTVHGFDRHAVRWREITHLALSHFHTDHVGDVAPLLFALRHGCRPPREAPLVIVGPPGLGRFLHHLGEAHGDFVREPGFPVEAMELPRRGEWADPGGRFRLGCHPTPHTESSMAYRVEAGGGVVGYTGDTGPSEALGRFFEGTHVLVSECALADPAEMDLHLSPRGVASLAARAAPELLIVTHVYPPLVPDEVPDLVAAAGYQGPVTVGRDGLMVELEDGSPRIVPAAAVRDGRRG